MKYLFFFIIVAMFLSFSCDGDEKAVPGKKGEKCSASKPCVEGLHCVKDKCTTQLDACKNIFCSNHGMCTVQGNRAICQCDIGYEVSPNGYKCNKGTPCSGVDCSGHGTCSPIGDKPNCTCENNYTPVYGIYCVSQENPCNDINCGNGTCKNAGGVPQCECDEGYEFDGIKCEKEIDLCSGVDCSGHGKCVEASGEATCQCDQGYSAGPNLTCVSNPCSPNPCLNMEGTNFEKTCQTTQNGGFMCICDISSSYQWDPAQKKCVKDNSNNKCEDANAHKDGSGKCVCNPNYKVDPNYKPDPQDPNNLGLICILDNPDPCASNPCAGFENKVCVANGDDYECQCKAGYKLDEFSGQNRCIPEGCNADTCTEPHKTICDLDASNNIKCFCDPGYKENTQGVCELSSACTATTCNKPNMTGECLPNAFEPHYYCQCKAGFVGENCNEAGDNWCCPEMDADGNCDNPCKYVEHSTGACYAMAFGYFCDCEAGYDFDEPNGIASCVIDEE